MDVLVVVGLLRLRFLVLVVLVFGSTTVASAAFASAWQVSYFNSPHYNSQNGSWICVKKAIGVNSWGASGQQASLAFVRHESGSSSSCGSSVSSPAGWLRGQVQIIKRWSGPCTAMPPLSYSSAGSTLSVSTPITSCGGGSGTEFYAWGRGDGVIYPSWQPDAFVTSPLHGWS
jgi:hypothetical protein